MPALLPPLTTQGKGQPDGAGASKAAERRGLWAIFGGGLNEAPCEVDIKSDSSSAEVGLRHCHCFCLVMFKCQWESRKKKRKICFFFGGRGSRIWRKRRSPVITCSKHLSKPLSRSPTEAAVSLENKQMM